MNVDLFWILLRCTSNHEQSVITKIFELKKNGILNFIKDVKIFYFSDDNLKNKYPGYIFLKVDDVSELDTLLKIKNVHSVYKKNNSIYRLEQKEIDMMSSSQNVKSDVFEIGDMVKILRGPFADLSGKIINISKDKAMVSIDIFGRNIDVDIRLDSLTVKIE